MRIDAGSVDVDVSCHCGESATRNVGGEYLCCEHSDEAHCPVSEQQEVIPVPLDTDDVPSLQMVISVQATRILELTASVGAAQIVYEAVRDLLWRATQYGTTEDGDTAAYLLTKGTVHRLMGAMFAAGAPASFRVESRAGGDDDG